MFCLERKERRSSKLSLTGPHLEVDKHGLLHAKKSPWATVVQWVEKSFSKQKVASSIPCRSVLEQDTEPLIAPDVQCAISVNVKNVYTSL